MKLILSIFIIGILFISCESKTSKDQRINKRLDSHIDSVSYAIGLDMAMRLEQQFMDIDYERLLSGIKDHYKENDLFLSDKERIAVIKKYNNITLPKYRMDLEKLNTIEGGKFMETNAKEKGVLEHQSGIQYKIIIPADGTKPKPTNYVKVHYVGKLIDGTTFDSSYDRGEPAVFPVNRVVPGFSQGLQLMSVGAKYQIFIPGHLGYGQGDGPGGPMAFMIFEVEILEILEAPIENK
jgi:FKBP-type peptidyl-prolyl cis-trans isomerase FkpA